MPWVPDHRWRDVQKVLATQIPSDDHYVMRTVDTIRGTTVDPIIKEAVDLISDSYYRDNLVAFIISRASIEVIAKCLWLSVDVVAAFQILYFDMHILPNKMEFRRYATQYAMMCRNPNIGALIEKAITEGSTSLEYYWRDPDAEFSLSGKDMSFRLALLSYFKSIEARNAKITSTLAKEALKWGQHTAKLLPVGEKLHDLDGNAIDAVCLLRSFEHTRTPAEAGIDLSELTRGD